MITLPKYTKTPGGAYGSYFRLSRTRGIKILRGSWRSISAAYNSRQFDLAKEEAGILAQAQESGVVPKCYGVRVVRRGKSYRVGILMQHLGDKTLSSLNVSEDDQSDIYDSLCDALTQAGIGHMDLHDRNIMFHKGKYYAIDFSPDCIDVLGNNA